MACCPVSSDAASVSLAGARDRGTNPETATARAPGAPCPPRQGVPQVAHLVDICRMPDVRAASRFARM
jgi:hypothetical protein